MKSESTRLGRNHTGIFSAVWNGAYLLVLSFRSLPGIPATRDGSGVVERIGALGDAEEKPTQTVVIEKMSIERG